MGIGKKVKEIRLARDLTQAQLAEMVGCKQADVQRIESGDVRNSKYLAPMLKLLNLSDNTQATVPVVGFIGAGAEVFAIDDHAKGDGIEQVPAPPGMLNGIALIVRGDSMSPKYDDGEIIYIEKTLHAIESLIGNICYLQLSDGRCFLKRLQLGSRPGTFNLLSLNGSAIPDAVVERAYPIAFVKPKRSF